MSESSAVLTSAWQRSLSPVGETMSGRRVTELLAEVQARIEAIVDGARERMNALLRSVIAVSDGLDLDETLRQITRAAIELVDARYGALGVIAEDGSIGQFTFVEADGQAESMFEPGSVGPVGSASVPDGEVPLIEEVKRLLLDDLLKNPLSAGFTPQDLSTRRFLGVPVLARGKVFGRLYLTERFQGAGLTEDDEIIVGALAAAAGLAVDNSRLYETGRRHRRWLEATAEVTTQLLGGGDAGEVLNLIARHALDLASADYTLIALPDAADNDAPNPAVLTVAVCVGMSEDSIVGRTVPILGSTSGDVFDDQIARNVNELSYNLAEGLGLEFGPALVLPLGIGSKLAGVLLAVRKPGSVVFDDRELQMVSLFAGQAMLALERTEIQAARRELQALAERDRIAHDLHDHVIQRLFAVGLAMEGTQQLAKVPAVSARLSDHVDQVYEVIGEIRSAIFDLQAGPPENAHVRNTLQQLITDLTADTPLRTTVRMSGPLGGLSVDLVGHLRAALSEAVSNVVRHAGATDVMITISVDDAVALDVVDDGTGISDSVARSGLLNLRQRAVAAGGTCSVTRLDEGGTRVQFTVPLSAAR